MHKILCVSRTRSHECSERLEPDIRERIRPVLRGGVDGNAAPLPDTMRMTVLGQYIKGLLRLDRVMGEGVRKRLDSVKWLLWHGQVTKALDRLGDLDRDINHFTDSYPRFPQLKTAVRQFPTYIVNNRACQAAALPRRRVALINDVAIYRGKLRCGASPFPPLRAA